MLRRQSWEPWRHFRFSLPGEAEMTLLLRAGCTFKEEMGLHVSQFAVHCVVLLTHVGALDYDFSAFAPAAASLAERIQIAGSAWHS